MLATRASRQLRRVYRARERDETDLGPVACSEGIAVVNGHKAKGDSFEQASSNLATNDDAAESTPPKI